MKKTVKKIVFYFLLVFAIIAESLLFIPVSGETGEFLGNDHFDILVTEVSLHPTGNSSNSFGQLIEIVNNKTSPIGLFDYEFMFTSGRSAAKQFKDQFRGGFFGKEGDTLQSGEIAIIWIAYTPEMAKLEIADVRKAMIEAGTPIAEGVRLFKYNTSIPKEGTNDLLLPGTVYTPDTVEAADPGNNTYVNNHLSLSQTRYLMVNKRGAYERNSKPEITLDQYVEGDGSLRGAMIRLYPAVHLSEDGRGMSQTFGSCQTTANPKSWQLDLNYTGTEAYAARVDITATPMTFGYLDSIARHDAEKQTVVFQYASAQKFALIAPILYADQAQAVANEVFSVRFLATIGAASLDYDVVGFYVKAKIGDNVMMPNPAWLSTRTVYSEILVDGNSVSADSMGGDYICALAVRDVPADITVTFEILAYGQKGDYIATSQTYLINYTNGVYSGTVEK